MSEDGIIGGFSATGGPSVGAGRAVGACAAEVGAICEAVGGDAGESGCVARSRMMVKSWRVTLPVCRCTFAGLLADGEAGRERGLDAEPGGDG
eukprot:1674777-Pleurochrysis_carterae.AAC.1